MRNPVEQYRKFAAECETLAANPKTSENRTVLLYLAKRWRLLAEEIEAAQGHKNKGEDAADQPSKSEG